MTTPDGPTRPGRRSDPLAGRRLPTPAQRILGSQLVGTQQQIQQAQRRVDALTGELAAAQQALNELTDAAAVMEGLLNRLDAEG